MTSLSLNGCHILVVEDEYFLASELSSGLMNEGATVVGPAANVNAALSLIGNARQLHGAILDINLGGEYVFSLADELIDRGVPLIFTTGYDRAALPTRYGKVPTCEKPVSLHRILTALRGIASH